MTATLIIGIDPGAKGAAVPLVDGGPVLVAGHPMAVRWDDVAATGASRAARIAGLPWAVHRALHGEAPFADLPPVERELRRMLGQPAPALVVIEQIAINYNGPARSSHAVIVADAGWCKGACDMVGWPVEQRLAGSWIGDVAEPPEGSDRCPKARALAAAHKWWPGVDWRASGRSQKPHDGLVDAALLALAGHLAMTRPGPWAVERDGTGQGWHDVYRGQSEYRAEWEYARAVAAMKRGAARLVRATGGDAVVCREERR